MVDTLSDAELDAIEAEINAASAEPWRTSTVRALVAALRAERTRTEHFIRVRDEEGEALMARYLETLEQLREIRAELERERTQNRELRAENERIRKLLHAVQRRARDELGIDF